MHSNNISAFTRLPAVQYALAAIQTVGSIR